MEPSPRRTWPFAMAGAVLLFAAVVMTSAGDDEASDSIVFGGSIAALVGALVGGVVNRR